MGGDCENLVNNSLLIVNKSLALMRQRIFKTIFAKFIFSAAQKITLRAT